LKIVHISDIHIRNLKYHSEYKRVFENLYKKLDQIKPDLIINTGDTAHTKTQISPEFVEMASEHMRRASEYAPYHMILGNHDMNMMNADRQDAITPIIDSIKSDKIFLHKKSGLSFTFKSGGVNYNFWTFSLADRERYPIPSDWAKLKDDVNIGLFHGSVTHCVTDMNWRMTQVEHDLTIFDGLDFAFLGDIHKQQFFRERTIAYPGSLIQQNFGEELEKGFLLWELNGKSKYNVTSHILDGSRKFHTIRLNTDLSIPDLKIEEGSRIRISPPVTITLAQQKEIEKKVKLQFKPYDVITLSAVDMGMQKATSGKDTASIENLRELNAQEKLIREYLKPKNLSEKILQKVLDLNRKYQIHVEQDDDTTRNIQWKVNKLLWSNFFNYGENNLIDFSQIPGLSGIFAPNASGKSNFIDILLETCFDATTKGVNKNIYLINDNKDNATAIADITVNDQNYMIERTVERIKYGTRKLEESKEWGKTSVNFSMLDGLGGTESLEGTLRPETERNIRQRLGTFDDFMLTSLSAQWNPMDVIGVKETKRKEIFYKFFDLDIFAQKGLLAKDESKEFFGRLHELEESGIEDAIKQYTFKIKQREEAIAEINKLITTNTDALEMIDANILHYTSLKKNVDISWKDLGDWAGRIKKADLSIESNEIKLKELVERLAAVDMDLAKVLKLEQRFDLEKFEVAEKRIEEIFGIISEIKIRANEKTGNLNYHKENVKLLGQVPCGDKFPSCKFLVNAFDSKNKITEIELELEDLSKRNLTLYNEREELWPLKNKLDAYREFTGEKESLTSRSDNLKLQIENMKLKIESLQSEKEQAVADKEKYEKAEGDLENNKMYDQMISNCQNNKIGVVKSLEELQKDLSTNDRLLGADQGILEKLSSQISELEDLRDMCTAFEVYGQAMGKDGIAYQILAQKIPMINEEINKILSNSADFNVHIEHDPEEQSIRFFIQYGQYKSRLLELGSGAEKFLGSLAIRVGLLNMSNLPKTNMFIIDEGFGKLDPKNLESIQRMFDYLRTVFEHIIVISHLDTMKDMVDNIIEITTDDEGYAHLNVGG